jgi:hypothetical protein
MRWLAGLLVMVTLWSLPGVASAADVGPLDVVDGWKTSLVYVDPSQRSLVSDKDAARLAERVAGHEPAIRIAVVPASTLDSSQEQETATSFVNSVADVQQADGIYLVVFGDLTTWGKAVGVDTPIADIVKSHQTRDSHSDPVKTLNGVLTQLNVPAASTAPPAWLWPLLAGLVLLLVAATALVWRKRRVAV